MSERAYDNGFEQGWKNGFEQGWKEGSEDTKIIIKQKVAELRKEIEKLDNHAKKSHIISKDYILGYCTALKVLKWDIVKLFGCEKPMKDKVSIKCQYGN